MPKYIVTGEDLTGIADAIRAKTGESSQITFPTGFVTEIGNLTDTRDATAYANKIRKGYTAYVNGVKLTGNYEPSPSNVYMFSKTITITAGASSAVNITTVQSRWNLVSDPIQEPYGSLCFGLFTSGTYDGTELTSSQLNKFKVYAFSWDSTHEYGVMWLKTTSGTFTIAASKSLALNYNYYDVVIP